MTYYAWAPEKGAKYVITSADGQRAAFNDKTDADYVGFLTDVTGLDSPDVRDSGDVLVEADGGFSANNYYGRRPITLAGTVAGHASIAERNLRLSKVRRATHAMRSDAALTWTGTEPGALTLYTPVRRQQPVRISDSQAAGPWNKDFQILLISEFAPVFSNAITTTAAGASETAENQGDYPAYPLITVTGPTVSPLTITNTTTGGVIKFLAGFTVASGHSIVIDTLAHAATLDGTTSVNASLDFVNSTWPPLLTGNNTYTVSSGTLSLQFRSAWL